MFYCILDIWAIAVVTLDPIHIFSSSRQSLWGLAHVPWPTLGSCNAKDSFVFRALVVLTWSVSLRCYHWTPIQSQLVPSLEVDGGDGVSQPGPHQSNFLTLVSRLPTTARLLAGSLWWPGWERSPPWAASCCWAERGTQEMLGPGYPLPLGDQETQPTRAAGWEWRIAFHVESLLLLACAHLQPLFHFFLLSHFVYESCVRE